MREARALGGQDVDGLVPLADRTPQHELNDFLQSELYHTLGSYGTAVQRLRALERRLAAHEGDPAWASLFPAEAVSRMREFNEALRARLNEPPKTAASGSSLPGVIAPARHPSPGENLGGDDARYPWVIDYYETAIGALELHQGTRPGRPTAEQRVLGEKLALIHDPQRGRATSRRLSRTLPSGRISRNKLRLQEAQKLLARPADGDRAGEILFDHLRADHAAPLHKHVIGALVDAHLRMHRAEHLLSHSFGAKVERRAEIDAMVRRELDCSLVLNTFAYVAGRTVPWIFAENDEERAYVVADYRHCCETLTPTYCAWIATQVSLLALHRRAYTWLLRGASERACNDFHKLKRFIRGIERELDVRVVQAPGAQTFLHGLSAFADHHTGRTYREQHAHTAALRHFERAAKRLEQLQRDGEVQEMLRNSRWRIDLLMNQAKASYELGRIKESLRCYAQAWRAFLELADTESNASANFQVINALIAWLERVEPDAEVNKLELSERLRPLVKQLETVRSPRHLRTLAADIMMRLAHLLFILKLPRIVNGAVPRDAQGELKPHHVDHTMARRCLTQAARLDASQTLIAADRLKFCGGDGAGGERAAPAVPAPSPIAEQWPGGSGQFEETARVVEYVLQRWLVDSENADHADDRPEQTIARELLSSFLAHTASTNVKLAQVYRYLMARRTVDPQAAEPPPIDMICLRRYSSFFPFLPRPSAFRVLGGGYFARVTENGKSFGIAIDPGPNFVDNLYRCGYALADVDMIVVTHDHADHIASLDAMLALFGYRKRLGDPTFDKGDHLLIVGNESVKKRYEFFNPTTRRRQPTRPSRPRTPKGRDDTVRVWTFEEWHRALTEPDAPLPKGLELPHELYSRIPKTLRIEPVRTYDHLDGGGHIAQGFQLSVASGGERCSVLFTSDMGPDPSWQTGEAPARDKPPQPSHGKPLAAAIEEADVVVAHLSAVPLPQLRKLAGLERTPAGSEPLTTELEPLWQSLCEQIEEHAASDEEEDRDWAQEQDFILRQVQFGFHSRPKDETIRTSPLAPWSKLKPSARGHLYLDGLLSLAALMRTATNPKLLLIGELHEELGTFRTRVARALNAYLFDGTPTRSLTADIGLRVRLQPGARTPIEVLCSTCQLDNDLVDEERYHAAEEIYEVCIKGEDEGIFYNCEVHDPEHQLEPTWVERLERPDPFGR